MSRPLRLRKLTASMEMKDLSLRDVVELANKNASRNARKIPYTTASEVLNGRRVSPSILDRLSAAIDKAPMPLEVAS